MDRVSVAVVIKIRCCEEGDDEEKLRGFGSCREDEKEV